MSAAVIRELTPASARMPSRTARTPSRTARMPSRTARPRLRLVGPAEREKRDQHVERLLRDNRFEPDRRFERAWAPTCPAKRLERRDRLVITLMSAAAVLALAVVFTIPVGAGAAQIDHATTVSAGQTLSEVAAAQLPSLPIHEAVARIQLANGLNTSDVHAGQSLLIPATR